MRGEIETAGLAVALGGNAILARTSRGTIDEQFAVVGDVLGDVARIAAGGGRILVTHGNGPIVGNIMIRNEAVRDTIPPMPLYICGADSQGGIGLMLQQVLANELRRIGSAREVATIVTQVVVDPDDPAFEDPSKPIGPYYTEGEADSIAEERGWLVRADGTRGHRRVVPSPRPVEIVELGVIERLLDDGVIVIAVGGGGVPVVRSPDGRLHGVDAVVDKDRATVLAAAGLGLATVAFVTGTDRIYLDYGTDDERALDVVRPEELARHLASGQFPRGSMGPKVEAAITFVSGGDRTAFVTSPGGLVAALAGRAGTRIVSGKRSKSSR